MAMYKSKKMPSIYGECHEDYENGHKPVYARVIDGEYPAKVQPGAKRMVKDEQGATMFLLAMCSLAAEVQRRLERRLKTVPNGMGRIKTIRSMVTKLAFDLLNTAPQEQREHIQRQCVGLAIFVGVRGEGPLNPDSEYGYYLNRNQFDLMIGAVREQCDLCTIEDPAEQAKCPYAKLLNVLPIDKQDEGAKGCGWFHPWRM
ncbi:MAG: hypothetical protein IJ124_14400 [Clostridia bacterium]|nr:hypothetical protein [Clostridia bacterium]